jgi:AAA family ATP:ADP antiporter
VLQFVVTPILLWRLPLALVHVALPALHVLAAMALLLRPSLTTGATAFLLFKGCDYSLFRAAKEILYLPLSYDERFRAKSVIDAFAYRCAKGVCSGLIGLAGLLAGPLPASLYPQLAMLAEGLWLVLVRGLTRQRRQT